MTDNSTLSSRHGQKGQAEAAGAAGKNYVDDHVEQVDRSPFGGPVYVGGSTKINVYSTALVVVGDIFRGPSQFLRSKVINIVSLIARIGCRSGKE